MPALFRSLSIVALVALTAPLAAFAAGTEDGSSAAATSSGTYADAKALIYAGKFAEARAILKEVTAAEPANADAWNLLGFSARKTGDLRAASKAYSKALKLNPTHLGALEYQGEMYIQMGEIDKAKANLAALQAACGTCEEMRDLQKALKAAGA